MSNTEHVPVEWIDEIPTRPSKIKAVFVSGAAAILGLLGFGIWVVGKKGFIYLLSTNEQLTDHFCTHNLLIPLHTLFPLIGFIGCICVATALLSVYRCRFTYLVLRTSLAFIYPTTLAYLFLTWQGVTVIVDNSLVFRGQEQSSATGMLVWWKLCWPAFAILLYTVWLHILLVSRSVYTAFTGDRGAAMAGDHTLEDWRTNGHDPQARKSLFASIGTHVLIIVIIPFVLQNLGGCVTIYEVPSEKTALTSNPIVIVVKEKEIKKTLTVRKGAEVFDYTPPDVYKPSDSGKVLKELIREPHVAGDATTKARGNKIGDGVGWIGGDLNGKVRFIRLRHGGVGWDDGMGKSGADSNFLNHFHTETRLKTSHTGESHPISSLANYEHDKFPPFVYITGNGRLGHISPRDIQILRDYCHKGGMLIADAGSSSFDRSFRHVIHKVFPGNQLKDISSDDIIYQSPNRFNGPPSFWHHGGSRPLGIKVNGRWAVFYHPGDMNDAWKSDGYSDVSDEMRENALDLGINIVFYAFNQWSDAVSKLRK